jgi:hypothetical protein
MDARVRESQIERGWLRHEPDRAKVPREVWRNLRTFKRVIAPVADRIEAASDDRDRIKGLLYDWTRKGDVGRARQQPGSRVIRNFEAERLIAVELPFALDPREAVADQNRVLRLALVLGIYLRCGPGLLICEAISGITPSKREYWYARAKTWISDSMIRPVQSPIAPAVGDDPSMLTLMMALVLRSPQSEDDAA